LSLLVAFSAVCLFSAALSLAEELSPMSHAVGTFEVKTLPQPAEDAAGGTAIGRMLLDKQFHGELEATSVGVMLGVRTPVQGSAGYVAQEVVTGTLGDRKGSFVLQHYGVMTRGALEQIVTVVPDSGTEQLTGLSGKMTITVENGAHNYRLDYTVP